MWTIIKASLFQLFVFCTTVLIIETSPIISRSTSLKLATDTRQQNKEKGPRTASRMQPEWSPEYLFGGRTRRYRRQARNRLRSLTKTHTFCSVGRLWSRNSPLILGVNGTVVKGIGSSNKINKSGADYTLVELQSHNSSVKRIKGVHSGKYVAVNGKGDIITENIPTNSSFWIEHLEEHGWLTFQSLEMVKTYPNVTNRWFLGIKIGGRIRRGKNTGPGMKASQFIFQRAPGFRCNGGSRARG